MRKNLLLVASILGAAPAPECEVAAGQSTPESGQIVDCKLAPVLAHLEELDLGRKGFGALDGQSLNLDEDLLFGEVLLVQAIVVGSCGCG